MRCCNYAFRVRNFAIVARRSRTGLRRRPSMMRLCFLLLGIAFACLPCKSQTLDSYGGLTNVKCQKATGWFHAEKINDRWWLCTPLGHAYFFEGVAAFQIPTLPKYNNSPNAAAAALISEVQSWKFNGIGGLYERPAEPVRAC